MQFNSEVQFTQPNCLHRYDNNIFQIKDYIDYEVHKRFQIVNYEVNIIISIEDYVVKKRFQIIDYEVHQIIDYKTNKIFISIYELCS